MAMFVDTLILDFKSVADPGFDLLAGCLPPGSASEIILNITKVTQAEVKNSNLLLQLPSWCPWFHRLDCHSRQTLHRPSLRGHHSPWQNKITLELQKIPWFFKVT